MQRNDKFQERFRRVVRNNRIAISAKQLIINFIIVMAITILLVYLTGLNNHRSLFLNSLISLFILTIFFFTFLIYSLYKGLKLKNDFVRFDLKSKFKSPFQNISSGSIDFDGISVDGDDIVSSIILSVIVNVLVWIIATVVFSVLFWLFGTIIWVSLILLFASLYWIIYRATRLALKNSHICRGNLPKSLWYAGAYTFFYNCWIFSLIFIVHYLF